MKIGQNSIYYLMLSEANLNGVFLVEKCILYARITVSQNKIISKLIIQYYTDLSFS